MEKFTFTRQADGSLHATDQTKASVALAFRQNPGTLSREIVNAAAADLVNKAKDLAFSTGKSYEEASTHLMSRDPWLALAVAVIGDDRADKALGIEIVEGARA
jgi:basic membrane lipoprotein Med (substrate-binding protein (PBP1-ABC) superfamily)